MRDLPLTVIAFAVLALPSCTRDEPSVPSSSETTAAGAALVAPSREERIALGLAHASASELYAALEDRAGGGTRLSPDDMPDWTGLWTRVGRPFFDPEQQPTELTTAKLRPAALEELRKRRELSAQDIEYDPISDCSPPGFPRWLAIPFLREFIVTPDQTYLFSETTNNMRRIYTDGRGHPPPDEAYPLYYGDSIGFWSGHTLVIHTNQVRAGIFHRNDPQYSEALETVEAWRKVDDATITADVWVYDPETLVEPWYVRQTYKQVPNPDGYLRIDYWHCGENPNNAVIKTDSGASQFRDFTFTETDDER
jgi:hypothetical protein